MSVERRLESRGRIYTFPQHFESLRDTLAGFIASVATRSTAANTSGV